MHTNLDPVFELHSCIAQLGHQFVGHASPNARGELDAVAVVTFFDQIEVVMGFRSFEAFNLASHPHATTERIIKRKVDLVNKFTDCVIVAFRFGVVDLVIIQLIIKFCVGWSHVTIMPEGW